MYTNTRDEEVRLLKGLWTAQPTLCPECGEIYRTINMLKELPDK